MESPIVLKWTLPGQFYRVKRGRYVELPAEPIFGGVTVIIIIIFSWGCMYIRWPLKWEDERPGLLPLDVVECHIGTSERKSFSLVQLFFSQGGTTKKWQRCRWMGRAGGIATPPPSPTTFPLGSFVSTSGQKMNTLIEYFFCIISRNWISLLYAVTAATVHSPSVPCRRHWNGKNTIRAPPPPPLFLLLFAKYWLG